MTARGRDAFQDVMLDLAGDNIQLTGTHENTEPDDILKSLTTKTTTHDERNITSRNLSTL